MVMTFEIMSQMIITDVAWSVWNRYHFRIRWWGRRSWLYPIQQALLKITSATASEWVYIKLSSNVNHSKTHICDKLRFYFIFSPLALSINLFWVICQPTWCHLLNRNHTLGRKNSLEDHIRGCTRLSTWSRHELDDHKPGEALYLFRGRSSDLFMFFAHLADSLFII